MHILLLGEYSKLHNSLKQGLIELGHHVTLVGDGDGFKNYSVDISYRPKYSRKFPFRQLNRFCTGLLGFNLQYLERGIRCFFHLKKFKGYDIVQLINEKPIQTFSRWERYFLKKIFKRNGKVVLLSCGADYLNVLYATNNPHEPSALTPYFENPSLKSQFAYLLDYLKPSHLPLHQLVMEHTSAVVASDFDYVPPLKEHPKFYGLIPNPVVATSVQTLYPKDIEPIEILLGINQWNYLAKGVPHFEEALEILQERYPERVVITKVQNLPYQTYVNYFRKTHILLDQTYAQDQGYNALEAMETGKVVFTGAGTDFLEYYRLKSDEVCIHAKPDVQYLIEKLIWFVEHPEKIESIGNKAKDFISREHDLLTIANKYNALYKSLIN